MTPSRRTVLGLGSSVGLAALAGCASVPSVGPRLTVTLLNFDSTPRFLDLELLRARGVERSEAVMLRQEFELPSPGDDAAAEVRLADVVDSRKLLVRAHLNDDRSVRGEYLFYPDCGDGDPDEELVVEITPTTRPRSRTSSSSSPAVGRTRGGTESEQARPISIPPFDHRRFAERDGAAVFRFEDDVVVEAWWYYDLLGMLRQLGVMPGGDAASARSSAPFYTTGPVGRETADGISRRKPQNET